MSFYRKISRLFVITTFVCVSSATVAFADIIGKVNDNTVNIRSEGTTDSKILTTANRGQEVKILAKEGEFFKIAHPQLNLDAYVHSQFITIAKMNATITDNNVNIRKQASTDSEILGTLAKGDNVEVVGVSGSWCVINQKGVEAFVHKDFLASDMMDMLPTMKNVVPVSNTKQVSETSTATASYALVTSRTGLILRKSPTQNSDALDTIPYDDVMDVVSPSNDWVGVIYNGKAGYVSAEFLEVRSGAKPSRESRSSALGDQIVEYGKQFLGTPYVWGGTSLTSGVDCSGFVYSVMKKYGVSLSRSSASMAASNGYTIKKDQLRSGDLVFFDTSGSNNGQVSHVGIYMGNGKFIHSSSSKRTWGVTISSLSEAYYVRTYVTSKRVLS